MKFLLIYKTDCGRLKNKAISSMIRLLHEAFVV